MASVSFTYGGNYDPDKLVRVDFDPTAYLNSQSDSISLGTRQTSGFFSINQPADSTYSSGYIFVDLDRGPVVGRTNYSVYADFSDNTASVYLGGGNWGDVLIGGSAADTIGGGAGNDKITGGAGGDTLDGGDGTDALSYATSSAGVTVHLDGSLLSGGDAAGDVISNFENLIGSKYADTLDGTSGSNVINGGAGADTMTGGDGNDMYYVDRVGDQIVELAGGGTDEVRSSISFSLAGLAEVENLTLRGSKDLDAVGNAGRNILRGNAGDNHLTGGGGQDRLIGGAGADIFVFIATSDSATGATTRDFIGDFSQAQGDKIDLSAIDANATLADDQAFAFLGIGVFTKTAGELRQTTVNGRELLEGDVNGDGKADFQIQLLGPSHVLQSSDFVL